MTLGLAALAFALAVAQRPGEASSDTKIGLHVDPVGFLGDVASAWSPTEDLGHVQGGQYGGYLFPMGPFFALGRLAGLDPWLVQRLWLGAVLALAAWGTVRLLDSLLGRPRGAAHVVAGLLILLNPYVAVFAARTSVTLLGYAALPWLLLCVHRGLRAPRSWWWPAAFALVVACTGGGVNAAVTAWVLLGPLLLAGYERLAGGVEWRALVSFGWRTLLLTALGAVWWVVPTLVQAIHGVDFLRFTEQPGTIWSTTSLSESLRLMGYWISYLGVGYGGRLRPLFGDGGVLLFSWPVVVAGLLVPALALTGFVLARRWRYGPFFLGLGLVGLLAMAAGFPEGTPLRQGLYFTYNHFTPVQFLRTTYKAGPLLALAVACLGGAAVARLHGRARPLAAVGLAVLAAVACWPLVRGQALDSQLAWEEIPAEWESAADHVDRVAGRDGRAVVLPGQLYASYDWGGTVDAILPALADRPVAVRYAVPYADLQAVDLLWTVDGLVQQRRALPGQLGPLLDLLGARTVVSGADDDRSRSGAVGAADAADVLDQLGRPDAAWGPVRREPRAAGTLGAPRALPRVRAWDRDGARPLVRVEGERGATVVDGSADGLAGLAALRALSPRARIAYAGNLSAAELVRAADGGEVVISDSNRRRVLAAARMAQNHGATLAADDPFSPDSAVVDPFPARGADAQTVARYEGVRFLRSPFSPAYSQFPERRPFVAFDGDPATHWQADRALEEIRHWVEVGFDAPRDVPFVELLPYSDRWARVTAVEVAGRRFGVRPGWNRLPLGLREVRSLRVRIARVAAPAGVPSGAGGLRELRIPGLRVREALRPPVLAERALAGRDLASTALSYLFERTTGDDPFRRDPRRGTASATLVRDRLDGEHGLEREFSPPAARSWTADGWGTVAADAADSALDALTGLDARAPRFDSSGRFQGRPGFRASSAFDGTARPWVGSWLDGRTAWLRWTAREPVTVRRLRIAPPREQVRRPTLVRLSWGASPGPAPSAAPAGRGAGQSPPLRVAPGGTVVLPRAARGRAFRLEILRSAFPPGAPGVVKQRRAVGIGELTGAGVPRARVVRTGPVRGRCGDLEGRLGPGPVRLRADATVADLDAGMPLRFRPCGGAATLPAGAARFSMPPGTFAPHLLRLRSPAPDPPVTAAALPGRVLDPGDPGRNTWKDIRLELREPAWLVLAQSYSDAWRGRCDGRDLGPPRPVDGFAMGWRVPADCRVAELAFAPDRLVRAGYIVSAPVLAALLLLLVLRRPPRPGLLPAGPGLAPQRAPGLAPHPDIPDAAPARLPARRAALLALAAGAVLGFMFAARAAPLIALAVFFILWRGVGVRGLVIAAGALLLVAVPVLTLLVEVEDRGGYNPEYAQNRIAVHWVTAAAVVLLMLALARVLGAARRRRSPA